MINHRYGERAFYNCTGLTSVTFEVGNIDIFSTTFPGDLRDKYFASGGGAGTYTRANGGNTGVFTWTKQ